MSKMPGLIMYQEISPARAKAKPLDKIEPLWTDPQWVAEHKVDGWRFLMHFGGGLPRTFMTGRRVSKEIGRLSEKGLCAPQLHPPDLWQRRMGYTVIDGEVMPPKKRHFRDIAGIMNVTPEKAQERIKEIGIPEYWTFDVLYLDGKDVRDMPWSWRKAAMNTLLSRVWKRNEHVRSLAHETKDKRRLYESLVEDGHEGVILKKQDAAYGEGWIKVKRYSTLDVIITGYTDAKHGLTGKYDGQIGAVIVSVYKGGKLVEVGQVSGMTDDMRKTFTKDRDRKPGKRIYIGQVIEIRAQELAKDRLRHPRYGRWRPEANPEDCTWEKMITDLKAVGGNNDK